MNDITLQISINFIQLKKPNQYMANSDLNDSHEEKQKK
jgi:hypothetical protein